MSFQAYIDTIKAKTGKTPEDFKKLAEKKGLLAPGIKAGSIVSWLKSDYGLGHGHAMAIYAVFKGLKEKKSDGKDLLNKHFSGEKEKWHPVYDTLLKKINGFGPDIKADPVSSYISLLRGDRKFAVIQITRNRMDLGLKIKEQPVTKRFEAAERWNAMMTHRVLLLSSKELDKELYTWLQKAYEQNGPKK